MPLALRLALAGATMVWWPRAGERGCGYGFGRSTGDGWGRGGGSGSGWGSGRGDGSGSGTPHPIEWCSWT